MLQLACPIPRTLRCLDFSGRNTRHACCVVSCNEKFTSIQNCISALGKAYMRSTKYLRSFFQCCP